MVHDRNPDIKAERGRKIEIKGCKAGEREDGEGSNKYEGEQNRMVSGRKRRVEYNVNGYKYIVE